MRNSWRRPDEEGRGGGKKPDVAADTKPSGFFRGKGTRLGECPAKVGGLCVGKTTGMGRGRKGGTFPGVRESFGRAAVGPGGEGNVPRGEEARPGEPVWNGLRGGKSVRLGKDCPRQKGNCFGKNPRVGKNLFFGQNSPLRREKKGGRRKKAHLEDAEKSVLRKKEAGKI